ncbi:hypothetical protein V8G54_008146, partial [Vigna mungo]
MFLTAAVAATKTQPMTKPNCLTKCGTVSIPFSFGLTKLCSLNTKFLIICNHNLSPCIPFFNATSNKKVRVLDISLDSQLHVALPVLTSCIDKKIVESMKDASIIVFPTPFHLSSKQNKLTVLGDDTT